MIPGSRGRILVVDDEPAFAELCAEQLQWAGYAVTVVGSTPEALAALDATAFDGVISDIRMPGISGIELLRQVRERDLLVPVILMTGDANVETAAQAVDLGALQYLTKPVPEKDLLAAAERAVRLRKVLAARGDFLSHIGARERLVWDRTGLEVRFDRALATLRVDYQPILNAGDGGLYGREALVRTAEDAFPHPGALFQAAGRLGRVTEVGRAVRATVAEWQAKRGPSTSFVNLHPEDLMDPALFDPGEPLSSHARNVVLEITERSNLSEVPDAQRRIRVLRGLGYRIAIDDLGAGYSGLSAVAAFEPQFVKLDISLVARCDQEHVKRNLIGAMTSFSHDTGILVVAEGIETEAEKAVVVAEGCDFLQGFLLGRPGPAA
jgi:EAL domain-containing protein (putative c-di-GMP-specific phosphodiesterase class I)